LILEAVLLLGLFGHKHKPQPTPAPAKPTISQATINGIDKVMVITKMMGPYLDEKNSQMRFEQDLIDIVEADVMECYQGPTSETEEGFLKNVKQLEEDMQALAAYDRMLQTESFI
jgi:hypothetical protein